MKKLLLVCLCLFSIGLFSEVYSNEKARRRFVEYSTPHVADRSKGTYTGGTRYLVDRKYNIVCYYGFRELSCVQVKGIPVE